MNCYQDKFNSVTADTEEKAALKIDPEELLKLLHSKDHVGAVACSEGEVYSLIPRFVTCNFISFNLK